jgi:hypothetical protein
MAAGLGFKDFVTGEVLTAGDVNGYLMQGVLVFASAAARNAAITSPQEGQFAYTKDTNGLWYYDGAAWVASGATGDIEGVTAGVGISGGGTSGTVTITNSMATAIDAKGDLVAGTGADTFARLAVGANDTVLIADSTTATGLKWGTPASGGMTLISQQSMSGSSTIQWTSIPGTYKHLLVTVNGYNTGGQMYTRLNSVSSSNYYNNTFGISSTEFYASGPISGSANSNYCNLYFWVYNYPASVGFKLIEGFGYMRNSASADSPRSIIGFLDSTTAAITSVQLVSSSGNFTAGTANLWGVS